MNGQYDERQLKERGKAFMAGFMFLAIYIGVNGCLFDKGIKWCSYINSAFIGIIASTTIVSVYLLIKDAYISVTESSLFMGILFNIISLAMIIFTIRDALRDHEGFIKNNMLSETGKNIILIILFSSIGITAIIKEVINRKALIKEN